ncbi:DUF4150 domain-containing protein [Nitrosospira sp. Nsp13]|uniref:DUF4150 domain-containing protein n=1 Tax=Nitrosospira sp. Nsp13 TaxID=1855332 RepID=UPI0008849D1C|nr:DUF4150 domain-containing protein [Nitrosospira sp. Nsp13]SCX77880.1 Protein of unknown function [Nitrosospira sp. Nsp13]
MPVTIRVNGTANSLVHKMSNGVSTATIPDVCKTPTPGGPVPIPYPNIAQSITLSNGTTTVKGDKVMAANKGSKLALSNGDQAGTIGGVKSNVFMKEATWILYSFDVKMDGKNAARFTDKMFHNSENAANLAGILQSVVTDLGLDQEEVDLANKLCEEFCKDLEKGHSKGPKGGWSSDPSKPSGNWSYQLESRLQNAQSSAARAIKKLGGLITERFTRSYGLLIPDVVLMTTNAAGQSVVKRCFDFKFPGDRWRKTQKLRQQKLAGGRKPVKINAKNCQC